MVYDSARGVTVLFGGSTGPSNYETWEWNGVWTQKQVQGPAISSPFMTMAYDSARGVTVLYGGVGLGATWEWNGSVWSQPAVNSPYGRQSHAMAYDSSRGVSVFFGGISGSTITNETWELHVLCYANCDGSTTAPILNVADFICFMNRYATADPYANCDGSTVQPLLNVADFICFQSGFAAGCP